MIEETQTIQDQTGQPAPQTQTPQGTEESTIQQTVDQQALESGTGSIQVPGSGEQSTTTTEPAPAAPTTEGLGFDIGLGLLVAVFVLAVTLISLLAWTAIRHNKRPSDEESESLPDNVQPNTDEENPDGGQAAPSQPKRFQKKLTRRQRRQAQQRKR